MAIIKSSVKLILQNDKLFHYSGKALALGVPEIYATQRELRRWFPSLAARDFPLSEAEVEITGHEVGRRLGWVTASTFLRALGMASTVSMDLPGGEHKPDLIHDLNEALPDGAVNQFDMVIDPGTTEHVFDIKTALTNVVQALKIGGVVIHQVPVYSYNGGYYSINPNVLNDFYALNGFGNLRTYIVMWDRYRAYTGRNLCYEYSAEILGARHALADYDQCRYSPHMLFLARKERQTGSVSVPRQFGGEYMAGLADQNEAGKSNDRLMGIMRGASRLLHRLLPYSAAYYLHAAARRNLFLLQTRRARFWM